eukprot:96859_1
MATAQFKFGDARRQIQFVVGHQNFVRINAEKTGHRRNGFAAEIHKCSLDASEYANVKAQFVLRASDLHNAKANMKVLHPLPRVDEIATDVDKTPHAWYFQQAGNGIFARQALLALVLNRDLVL